MECPKCGYFRKAEDPFPEYECPLCRVVYDRYRGEPHSSMGCEIIATKKDAQKKYRALKRKVWLLNGALIMIVLVSLVAVFAGVLFQPAA
ncbi:hypothetical protein LZ24_02542 [Desulfobotulus alkaliphilus]|uniref:Uncharacterized protein n=1 Tax=Desulfobotulus alkaliphilus TaxID=622671 RepID=A0A562RHI5_9BACT|nr:hypothetical protein [Desulfobotulus alkaliphilus]TWI68569.1 hypothetical protein LZ24_02542 [Desulfobotulus alkaliphilus]